MTRRINVMYAGFVVESATTADLFARPSHPYTVGLLHSLPRLDAQPGELLIPIEGAPPDLRFAPVGCPFAPRCAWRVERCWKEMPPLEPLGPLGPLGATTDVQMTGPQATHRAACWNRPTAQEAAAGWPLRADFVAAPEPIEAPR
jgi:oligopeptide/dipeptide ABC transporter ATP-binding protein